MNQRDKKKYKLLDNTYDCHMYPMGQRIRDLDNEKELTQEEVVKLLNNQQSELENQKEAIENEKKDYRELFSDYVALEEENEDLRQSIKELQRSREYWIQDNNRLTKRNNELIAKIDYLERICVCLEK